MISQNRILIINTAFLGDIALTSFLIQAIKDKLECEISVITTPKGAEVLKPVNKLDNIFIYDKRGIHKSMSMTKDFAKSISKTPFDHILSLHKSYRTSHLVKHLKGLNKIGYKDSSFSQVYTTKMSSNFHLHEAEKYLQFLMALNINDKQDISKINIELNFREEDKNYIDNLLVFGKYDSEKPIICLAPGSVWKSKKWGNGKYSQLAYKLSENYNVVIIGTNEDRIEIKDDRIIDITGKTKIKHIYYLLNISDLLVTNDSAPTHLASIVNCPTITIYGPTDPLFGFYPIADKSTSIINENLNCHPCRIHGSEDCPIGTHECMKSIKVDDIIDKISEILIPVQTS